MSKETLIEIKQFAGREFAGFINGKMVQRFVQEAWAKDWLEKEKQKAKIIAGQSHIKVGDEVAEIRFKNLKKPTEKRIAVNVLTIAQITPKNFVFGDVLKQYFDRASLCYKDSPTSKELIGWRCISFNPADIAAAREYLTAAKIERQKQEEREQQEKEFRARPEYKLACELIDYNEQENTLKAFSRLGLDKLNQIKTWLEEAK